MRVELEGVRKSYRLPGVGGAVHALDGVELAIGSGELCLLQGPSGSGKTTLISVVAGLAIPTSGKVLLDGASLPRARGAISCAFQESYFVPELTVLENLTLPAVRYRSVVPTGRAERLLGEFGLSELFDLFPAALSLGERRRLNLARALFLPHRLLLLDEPSDCMDVEWSRKTMDIVLADVRAKGTTLIMTTSNPIAGMEGARVVRMERGKVSADDGKYY